MQTVSIVVFEESEQLNTHSLVVQKLEKTGLLLLPQLFSPLGLLGPLVRRHYLQHSTLTLLRRDVPPFLSLPRKTLPEKVRLRPVEQALLELHAFQYLLRGTGSRLVGRDVGVLGELGEEVGVWEGLVMRCTRQALNLQTEGFYFVLQIADVKDVLFELVLEGFLFVLHAFEGFVALAPLGLEELSGFFFGAPALGDELFDVFGTGLFFEEGEFLFEGLGFVCKFLHELQFTALVVVFVDALVFVHHIGHGGCFLFFLDRGHLYLLLR